MSWIRLTMADIEAFYKGIGAHPFLSVEDLFEFQKTAGAVESGLIPDYRNPIYGALIWRQLNTEANAFGVLPKTNWPRSGWRARKDWATTAADIAIAETGAIPNAVYPEVSVVRATPKMAVLTFEVSDIMEALAEQSADDIWGSVAQMRADMGIEFVKMINRQILSRAIGRTDATTTAGAGYQLESLDRIVASKDEYDAFGLTVGSSAYNVYNIDRSTDTWANAVVKYSTDATGQDLTDDLIRETWAEARQKGAQSNLIITGYDTYAKIQGIYTNFVRWTPMGQAKIRIGINGIETVEGHDFGINVASLYGMPLIQAVDTPNEGISGFASRMYILDTTDLEGYGVPRLSISVLRPVEYFETRDYALLQKFAVRGVYRFAGEVTARFLPGQAKIRDITA